MKYIPIIGFVLVLSLGGCANLQNAWNTVSGATVSTQAVVVAANTFDALEATATNYLRLPKCTASNGPVCRSPSVTVKLVSAVRAGRVARANLEQFMRDHPGQLGSKGLYDAFQASITTLQDVVAQYKVGAR